MSELHRFRPTRAGIVNLYEYADQTFVFSGGRLLLRGHNTSGKTKALEVLLPFVLDGNISPQRLDPFAQSAKEMKWNLVGCRDVEQRVGYAWLEFERLDSEGGVERVTAGIGLRAHRARPEVKRWHFVVHRRRIGEDLLLVRDGREPLSRQDLVAAIGDDGEVLDGQSDYRARLREALFDFATEEQHQTMLRLMRELRRPHLSKTLDPDAVADTLSAGLPEVDEPLMRRLAGGLEQLESLEARLQRLRRVRDQVRHFHERTYRAYLRAELRERAAALRGADSEVGRASETARAAASEHETTVAEHEQLVEALGRARADVDRLDGEERALVESAAWSGVAEVEGLRERAEAQGRAARALEERFEDEAAAAGALEAELILAREGVAQAEEGAGADLERLDEEALRAGLWERTRSLDQQLRDRSVTPQSWRELVEELATGRAAVLTEHGRLLAAVLDAVAALDRAREHERAEGERAGIEATARDTASAQLEARRTELDVALDGWLRELVELEVGPDAVDAARAAGRGGHGLGPALDADVGRVRRALAADRAQVDVERERLEAQRRELDERRAALEAEHDVPPTPPAWRTAERAERTGAPLWALVDFVPRLTGEDRAGLEAALEAAGLLDAWITPDGQPLTTDVRDAALTDLGEGGVGSPGIEPGPTLAEVLVPVSDGAVDAAVVDRLLRGISLEAGWVRLGRDGTFRLGPLAGAAAKPAAEHVGATARAARRARLLDEVAGERRCVDSRLAELADALAVLAAREERLEAELESLPLAQPVAEAIQAEALASARADAAAAEHERARTAWAHAQDVELAARAAAREHAVAHGLATDLDAHGVSLRREACLRLEVGAGGVAQRFERVTALRSDLEQRDHRLGQMRERTAHLETEARGERTEARRLEAEHAARDAALGVEEREVRERHEQAQRALRERRKELAATDESERQTAVRVAGLGHGAQAAQRALTAARERRMTAHGALLALATAGLLPLALGDDVPGDHEHAANWTMSRALEVARSLPASITSTSTAPGRQAENVMRGVAELDRELAQADMGAHGAPAQDGLLLVLITEGAVLRPFAEAVSELDTEIAERDRVLSAEERRVFGEAIIGELAEHLRKRVLDVHARVERMNAVLRRAPTAAGKTVQLEWRAIDDDELRGATEVLRRSASFMTEEDRRQVVEFFRQRVELARRAAAEGAPEPMAQTLATAFDYRRWHRFGLLLDVDGRRERLTRRSHAVGSGGEQSALIHLPLFAAAAALYGEGRGPRLVMLDEALSGIDDDTRERVLAATVAFDLDLVMTSHELWGTYASVPSLAIYQLHREQGSFGVHAIPFLWDGAQLREDEQGELFIA